MLKSDTIVAFLDAVKSGIAVIDTRSPKEFEIGHIPGAINLALLNNEERHEVGTTYKHSGRDAAVKLGYELVGHKFASYIDRAKALAPGGRVLIYCWRGGIRSNTMAWLLSSAGMDVTILEGGYKEFRRWCIHHFERAWPLVVLSGKTGAGKTEILHELSALGECVLDLEGLANHRGSAFGSLGLPDQPTQEMFENRIAWQLADFNASKRIWIENESRFIGRVRIPDSFFTQTTSANLIYIDRDVESRAIRILDEYGSFDKTILAEKTKGITKRMGGDRVKVSLDALEAGDMMGWVMPLLDYYDRNYTHSIQERKGHCERELKITHQSVAEIARELMLSNKKG
jgi:tRNA 2-selenouridine synthase